MILRSVTPRAGCRVGVLVGFNDDDFEAVELLLDELFLRVELLFDDGCLVGLFVLVLVGDLEGDEVEEEGVDEVVLIPVDDEEEEGVELAGLALDFVVVLLAEEDAGAAVFAAVLFAATVTVPATAVVAVAGFDSTL